VKLKSSASATGRLLFFYMPLFLLPKVYMFVIAARVRMDMKIAFGDVKETMKKIYQKKGKKK
jgi:hypothetical protein